MEAIDLKNSPTGNKAILNSGGGTAQFKVDDVDLFAPWEVVRLEPEMKRLVAAIDGSDPLLRDLHAEGVRQWITAGGSNLLQDEWFSLTANYNEREHGGAWGFSVRDFWTYEIECRIEAYTPPDDDPLAFTRVPNSVLSELASAHRHYEKFGARGLQANSINEIMRAFELVWAGYSPNRHIEPAYWVAVGSECFMGQFTAKLAEAWDDRVDWSIVRGNNHHVVVDDKNHRIFDMFASSPFYEFRDPALQIMARAGFDLRSEVTPTG